MSNDGGQRIATIDGAMLADPASLGNRMVLGDAAGLGNFFEPEFWRARGELSDVTRGRGSAWFISAADQHWVLRHYRRGGFIARFAEDGYVWAGEARVRAFAEWRLLQALTAHGLPVPKPIAARYRRRGLLYRCDLITCRIAGADPVSTRLARGVLSAEVWREIGTTVGRLHAAGVDHADLNAHNILLDAADRVTVIDFDRGRLRGNLGQLPTAGSWAAANLSRLRRSLAKIARDMPPDRFGAGQWRALLDGYGQAPRPDAPRL